MSVARPSASMGPPGLRFLGLLIVVAGLFGMHGLASYGVQGMEMVPGTVLTAPSTAEPVGHTNFAAMGAAGQAVVMTDHSESLQRSDSGHGGMDMSVAMMCLVVLGAALLALLQWLRRERPWSALWARPYRTRVIMRTGRGSASPSLLDLSIQRC